MEYNKHLQEKTSERRGQMYISATSGSLGDASENAQREEERLTVSNLRKKTGDKAKNHTTA